MFELLDQLAGVANRIKSLEDSRQKLGNFLREIKDDVGIKGREFIEEGLVHKVSPDPLKSARVIGIDGGLSQHAYHGLDLILARAVAVVCDYSCGKLENTTYFPSAIVTPRLIVIADPYSDEEWTVSTSLEREQTEIETAIESFNKFSPDMLLLDGSVVPHGNDRPPKNSSAYSRYAAVIERFNNLYNTAGGKLAGCVEDSRGRRFCEIVADKVLSQIESPLIPQLQKILAGTRDTNLLYHVLDTGERTAVFHYSSGDNPILADLGVKDKIFSFYIKTAEFDRPVRVDFWSEPANAVKTAERIAALILPLCGHSSYGFPAPLIEADVRAKLSERDADTLHDQLVDRVGITPSLLKLRRENRPF